MKALGCGDRVIAALFVLATMLLFTNLDSGYLWQDEAETALLARNTLTFGYPRMSDGLNDIEEPAHGSGPGEAWIYSSWLPFYLLAGVFALMGESTWMARFPFAFLGLVSVYLTWRLAARLTDDVRVQRVSMALLTCSVPFLLHMRQCRYYALGTLLLLGVCLAYLEFVSRPSFSRAMGLAVLLALLFHANFGTFIPAVAAVCLHQAGWGSRATRWRCGVAMGVVAALTISWATFFYQPTFIGTMSLHRAYRHLEYYLRGTNQYFIPAAFMMVTSVGLALMDRWTRFRSAVRPLAPSIRWFLILMVGLQAAFLLLPDQRHLRYLLPVFPLLAIGEAWWLVSLGLTLRWRWVGWAVAVLALGTTALQSLHPTVPLADFAYELTHRYAGPMEGVVGYLRAHGKPGQVVKIPYDDRTVMFYTSMKVERPSEFLRETSPDWVVIRRDWIPASFFESAYFSRIRATYERIELDAPDASWQNREDPGEHHFRTVTDAPRVVVYRKREPAHG